MDSIVKILKIADITHDVKSFTAAKPALYTFIPGQAALVSINKNGWKDKKRPFTFTSFSEDETLEFIIKKYERGGVTEELHKLKEGDELILSGPFGAIQYKGKGVFIAGGAGITPFIAIFRKLKKDNMLFGNSLIFSNKTSADVILENELKEMFKDAPKNLMLILTQEKKEGYEDKRIDGNFLKEKINNFSQKFYVCGPPPFTASIINILASLGAGNDSYVLES